MKTIAIIPARGGSKRLPRKNILPISGHPMLAYPIKVALKSQCFDQVIVSTEDDEISKIAQTYGATVIPRPVSLAQDSSTVFEVCQQLISLPAYTEVQTICCLYATAIFIQPQHIVESYRLLQNSSARYVMGVSEYNYHPLRALTEDNQGFLVSLFPDHVTQQSQLFPQTCVSNGTIYWAKREAIEQDNNFYGDKIKAYHTPSVDIDTPEDYQHALQRAQLASLHLT